MRSLPKGNRKMILKDFCDHRKMILEVFLIVQFLCLYFRLSFYMVVEIPIEKKNLIIQRK